MYYFANTVYSVHCTVYTVHCTLSYATILSSVYRHYTLFGPLHIMFSFDARPEGDHITQTLVDLYLSGTETTFNTIQWACLFLIRNPEVQAKCHAEIVDVIGDREATLDDRKDMPYNLAMFNEVMRMGSISEYTRTYRSLWRIVTLKVRCVLYLINVSSLIFERDIYIFKCVFRIDITI